MCAASISMNNPRCQVVTATARGIGLRVGDGKVNRYFLVIYIVLGKGCITVGVFSVHSM
jgi:hypothetical protein